MSTSSPEINALLATLGVAEGQRRQGSVGSRSRDVPMTEVSAVLKNGTSDTYSLLGRAQTVFVGGRGEDSISETGSDAVTLFPQSFVTSGHPRKYPIFMLPTDLGSLMAICRSRIGKGRTFCLVQNCTTNHQGGLVSVKPGDIVVAKVPGRIAFETPRISSTNLDNSVVGEWISLQHTLTNWTNQFGQAQDVEEIGQTVDLKLLEIRIEDERKAVLFKTPRRKRGTMISEKTPAGIGISPYAKMLSGDESFADISEGKAQEKIRDVILRLDSALEELSAYSVMLGQDVEKLGAASLVNFRMLENKLIVAARSIGTRAEDLASDLDSPTVWSALAAINQKVEEVRALESKHREPTFESDPSLASKVSRLEKDLLSTVTQLSHAISGLSTRLDDKVSPAVEMDTSETLGAGFYADLQERTAKMTSQIKNLKAEKQKPKSRKANFGDQVCWPGVRYPSDSQCLAQPQRPYY
jgi:hypothetical protein